MTIKVIVKVPPENPHTVKAKKAFKEFTERIANYVFAKPETARDAFLRVRDFGDALADAVGSAANKPRGIKPLVESQIEYLNRLEALGLIDANEAKALHEIRKISNTALHNDPFSENDVILAKRQVDYLCRRAGFNLLPVRIVDNTSQLIRVYPSSGISRQLDSKSANSGRTELVPTAKHPMGSRYANAIEWRNRNFQMTVKSITAIIITIVISLLLYSCQVGTVPILDKIAGLFKTAPRPPDLQTLPGRARYVVHPSDGASRILLRSQPNGNSSVVDRIAAGSKLVGTAFADGNDGRRWMRVETSSGLSGWMASEFLIKDPAVIAVIRLGSSFDNVLVDPRPNGILNGDPAPVAIEYDFKNATEGLTRFDVSLSPQIVGFNCVITATQLDGRAGCNIGQLPPGAYRASVSIDGVVQKELRFKVVGNIRPEESEKLNDVAQPTSTVPQQSIFRPDVSTASPEVSSERYTPREPERSSPIGNPGKWYRDVDYPAGALRRNEEGSATVRFYVEPDGSVKNCFVVISSGSDELDRETCSVLQRRGRYAPARDLNGYAVRSVEQQSVTWRLPSP